MGGGVQTEAERGREREGEGGRGGKREGEGGRERERDYFAGLQSKGIGRQRCIGMHRLP